MDVVRDMLDDGISGRNRVGLLPHPNLTADFTDCPTRISRPEVTNYMISLVDDDPGVLAANAGLLRSLGYEVMTFESCRELLDWSGLAETCCVIADVMMPEIDGFELQRRLALQGFQFPVIFLTAVAEQAATERLLRGGAYDVLSKPCPEKRLMDCLEAALEHCRQHH